MNECGFWLSAVRFWLSAVRCPLLAIRCPLSAFGYQLSAVRFWLSAVRCPLLAISYPLSAFGYPLSAVRFWLSAVRCPVVTCIQKPAAKSLKPVASSSSQNQSLLKSSFSWVASSGFSLPANIRRISRRRKAPSNCRISSGV